MTWTAVVECPDDNLIVENFTSEEPTVVESTVAYQIEGGSDIGASTTDMLDDSDQDDS